MSLVPKIDKVCVVTNSISPDFLSITETWLQEHVHSNVIELNGIINNIQYSVLQTLSDSSFEVQWIRMRPTHLPRGVSPLIVGTVYHTPKADDSEMLNYLIESMSLIEANYFGCSVIILGDFNSLNISRLITNFRPWWRQKGAGGQQSPCRGVLAPLSGKSYTFVGEN